MLYVKDTSTVPDEGWQYPAIQGPPIKATCYQQLYGKIRKHYEGNGVPSPTEQDMIQWVCDNLAVPCYDGQAPHRNKYTDPPSFVSMGKVGPDWPFLLLPLKLLAQPEDRGLGDIVARTIGPIGGDAYKSWFQKIFGKPCGCNERQENLNTSYPL